MLEVIRKASAARGIPPRTKSLVTLTHQQESIRLLTSSLQGFLPRIDLLLRKWQQYVHDDSNMTDLLVALFNCAVDNSEEVTDLAALLSQLELEINLSSKDLSPVNAENEWFSEEMTQCVKHVGRFSSRFMKLEMFETTVRDSAPQLVQLDQNSYTYFDSTIVDEVELAQRVIMHFGEQLQQTLSGHKLPENMEEMSVLIGERFSKSVEAKFRDTLVGFTESAQSHSHLDLKGIAQTIEQLKTMIDSSPDWSTVDIDDQLGNLAEMKEALLISQRDQNRRDLFIETVARIIAAYDRKLADSHTAHTTIDTLSLLIEIEIDFLEQSKTLPIYDYRKQLMQQIADNRVVMIISGTGSGKSTCVPQYLLNEHLISGFASTSRRICIAQPRRKATVSLAEHMSIVRDSNLGDTVGYHIGKQQSVTRKNVTMIECMTFGILLSKATSDPSFSQYSVLFIDEVHEHSPDLFLLLGTVLLALKLNPDLKVVLMSATIDPTPISEHFGQVEICRIPVKTPHPIEIEYKPSDPKEAADVAVHECIAIHEGKLDASPDILVFLPLVGMITKACDKLKKYAKENGITNLVVLPFYSNLAEEEKKKVSKRSLCGKGDFRRVVFSTNIAETSLTLEKLGFVIDSGLQMVVTSEMNTEVVTRRVANISQSAAIQRRGRVGRTAPGKCICLYSAAEYVLLISEQASGYADICFPILGFIKNKISLVGFPWFKRPTDQEMVIAVELLCDLGFVDGGVDGLIQLGSTTTYKLSHMGEIALLFRGSGLSIRQTRFLFESVRYDLMEEAVIVFALMVSGIDPRSENDTEEEEVVNVIEADDAQDDYEEEDYDGFEEEEYYRRQWFKNPNSSIETLLYHYTEWVKDKSYKGFPESKMKRFRLAKADIMHVVVRTDLVKRLGFARRISSDPFTSCLAVSFFSNIGHLTLESRHPYSNSINSALYPINPQLSNFLLVSGHAKSRYGFENHLLENIRPCLICKKDIFVYPKSAPAPPFEGPSSKNYSSSGDSFKSTALEDSGESVYESADEGPDATKTDDFASFCDKEKTDSASIDLMDGLFQKLNLDSPNKKLSSNATPLMDISCVDLSEAQDHDGTDMPMLRRIEMMVAQKAKLANAPIAAAPSITQPTTTTRPVISGQLEAVEIKSDILSQLFAFPSTDLTTLKAVQIEVPTFECPTTPHFYFNLVSMRAGKTIFGNHFHRIHDLDELELPSKWKPLLEGMIQKYEQELDNVVDHECARKQFSDY